jgi:hypothetical protein
MCIYSVDSDEAMKRGNEALNASSLQFFSIVKRFIATICYQHLTLHRRYFLYERLFNASSPLLLKRNSSLNASSLLLFKVTLPTSDYFPISVGHSDSAPQNKLYHILYPVCISTLPVIYKIIFSTMFVRLVGINIFDLI